MLRVSSGIELSIWLFQLKSSSIFYVYEIEVLFLLERAASPKSDVLTPKVIEIILSRRI